MVTTLVRERWWVDGWELTDGFYRDIAVRDGLYDSAPPSSQAQATYIVGRHGVLDPLRRTADAGSFVVQGWLLEDRFVNAAADFQLLLRAAGQYARPSHWQRQKADGSIIECWARLTDQVQPTPLGQQGMRWSLALQIAAAFWQDSAVSSDQAQGASPLVLPLTSKAKASAPMTDLVYAITGPITNPSVICISDPAIVDSFLFSGIIPAGVTLTFDAGTWAITGNGMVAPTLDTVTWTGNRLLEVPPASPGVVPTVELTGSGTTSSTKLVVSGRAKYASAA